MKKLLVVLVFLSIAIYLDWYSFTTSHVALEHAQFIVEKGDNYSTIEGRLLNGNAAFFPDVLYKLYVQLHGGVIKPGVRNFVEAPTFTTLFDSLTQDVQPIKLRLPEGETEITFSSILAQMGVTTKADVLNCFKSCVLDNYKDWRFPGVGYEGVLFPDTYFFAADSKPELILSTMLGNFSKRIAPLQKKYADTLNKRGLKNIIIIASLLEREALSIEDKRMVAGILYKRLDTGMRLDVDATVLYIKGDWKAGLTATDLASTSPYNTRKFAGLPPGPICNPGIESIEAAFSPIASAYLYYLTDQNGHMHYAATLEGHVQNKWKFL